MKNNFKQLSYEEREQIYRGLCSEKSRRSIAKELGRAISTISREILRNSDHVGYFFPSQSHEMTRQRKHKNKPKIDKKLALKIYVIEGLTKRWSPKMIAGTWNLENPSYTIVAETIYEWIYSKVGEELMLKNLLLRSRKKRGLKRKISYSKMKNRVSIHERPEDIIPNP